MTPICVSGFQLRTLWAMGIPPLAVVWIIHPTMNDSPNGGMPVKMCTQTATIPEHSRNAHNGRFGIFGVNAKKQPTSRASAQNGVHSPCVGNRDVRAKKRKAANVHAKESETHLAR